MFVKCELSSIKGSLPTWYVTGNFVGVGNKFVIVKSKDKQTAIKKGMDLLNSKW